MSSVISLAISGVHRSSESKRKNPIMAALSEDFISQSPIPFKPDLNHARAHLLDDLGSAILTPGVCNDDFIGPSDALW
jgi:hypothetical protein